MSDSAIACEAGAVAALCEQPDHEAFVGQPLDHRLQRRPVELVEVVVREEPVGALVEWHEHDRDLGEIAPAASLIDRQRHQAFAGLEDLLGPAELVEHDASRAAQRVAQDVVGSLCRTAEEPGAPVGGRHLAIHGSGAHQPSAGRFACFGQLLEHLLHRRKTEREERRHVDRRLPDVGEGRQHGPRLKCTEDARQVDALPIVRGVAQEQIVLVVLHPLLLVVLEGGIVVGAVTRPAHELEIEDVVHLGREDAGEGGEGPVEVEVGVDLEVRVLRLRIVVVELAGSKPGVLRGEEPTHREHRHALGLAQLDGVAQHLHALAPRLAHLVRDERDVGFDRKPRLHALFVALVRGELVPVLGEHLRHLPAKSWRARRPRPRPCRSRRPR